MSEPTPHDTFDPAFPVLEFRQASFDPLSGYAIGHQRINLTLRGGELMLIRAPSTGPEFRLADAAQGLLAPSSGDVWYRDKDWQKLGARAAERRRGEIGRVFARNAWVSNLDVEENAMLRLKHHASLGRRQVAARARAAAAAFGIDALPQSRPSEVPATELQVAQWIRAFAGEPSLVLLEYPVNADDLPVDRLVHSVRAMRVRGGAIIWITARHDIWDDKALEPRRRFAVEDHAIMACREDG